MLSNSVCNHSRDKQIGLPLRSRPILLSLVWLQTELDFNQSNYHYLLYLLVSARAEIVQFSGPCHGIGAEWEKAPFPAPPRPSPSPGKVPGKEFEKALEK